MHLRRLRPALIHIARKLHVDDDFRVELDNTVYALDATTIDLCLSVFPWAQFRATNSTVKTQIWITVSVYVLVAIIRKRLRLRASLHTILQISSVPIFEKMPLNQALTGSHRAMEHIETPNQLNLFD